MLHRRELHPLGISLEFEQHHTAVVLFRGKRVSLYADLSTTHNQVSRNIV